MLLRRISKESKVDFKNVHILSVKNGFWEMFNAISELKLVSKTASLTSVYFLNTWKPSPRTNFLGILGICGNKNLMEWILQIITSSVIVRSKKYLKVLIISKFTSSITCILIIFLFSLVFTISIIFFQKEVETYIHMSAHSQEFHTSIVNLIANSENRWVLILLQTCA